MTVVHIVIVKFKPEITEEARDAAIQDILALKDKIPQIINISAGKNFAFARAKGFEYGWVMDFGSKEDLVIYNDHQHHQAFIKDHRPNLEDTLAFDYEF